MAARTTYALIEQTNQSGGSSLHLNVYDVIGEYASGGDGNTTARSVALALEQNQTASEIFVRICSIGGILDEARAVRARLVAHPAKVTVDVDGVAASAATVIMAAGNTIRIGKSCALMIHEARSGRRGANEADYLSAARELRVDNEAMAQLYADVAASRGKKTTKEEFREMMAKETWFSAQEAVDIGLADEIVESIPDAIVAQLDLSQCSAVPGWVASRFVNMEAQMRTHSTASAAALAAASQQTPPPGAQGKQKEPQMDLSSITTALGITNASEENVVKMIAQLVSAKGERDKLLEAVGAKSTDEAVGLVKALNEKAALADASAKALADSQAKALADKKTALIVSASTPAKSRDVDPSNPHAGKLTPALKGWAEKSSIETLEGFLAGAPVVLVGDGVREPTHATGSNGGTVVLSHNGKTFAQMPPKARAELKKDNPELYASMRQTWIDSGSPAATN